MNTQIGTQRALVIGGTSGIGLATARAFLTAGADVTIASRRPENLERAQAELGPIQTSTVDILDEASVEALFAVQAYDHVVVTAAATKGGPVRSLPLEDAYRSMDSKFWGAYRVARAARITEHGSLTLTSGFLSQRPSATSVLQGAINAALEGLVRGLALESAPVRVNAVSPGLIDTPLYSGMDEQKRREMLSRAATQLPVNRVGAADDVAQAILLLATNPYVTGTVLTVDGGGSIA